jgi:hypothetical protein
MHTVRGSLVGVVILALLGGLGGAVLAQDDEDELMRPAYVTGSVPSLVFTSPGSDTTGVGRFASEGVGQTQTWEADDPRLSGEATYTGNWRLYGDPYEVGVEAGRWTITNDDGTWAGTSTAVEAREPATWEPKVYMETLILDGQGGYDGLTAYLLIDGSPDPKVFQGIIFPDTMAEPPAE